MRLHWHRQDLRTVDNRGLAAASADSRDGEDGSAILPVFVVDEDVLAHAGPPRVAFLRDALAALRDWYRALGGDLLVTSGDPSGVLVDLVRAYGVEEVTWCRDYSGLARERDAAVRAALEDAGVAVEAVHDAVCHPPESITTTAGECYSVFTYYGRKWHDREKPPVAPEPPAGSIASPDEGDREPIPGPGALGVEPPDADVPSGDREACLDRLERFCEGPIYRYEEARDYPGEEGTSRLSPHLTFGTLGPREVHAATREAAAAAPDDEARESVRTFQDQLAWREFYAQVLWANPQTVSANFRDFPEPIDWRNDPAELRAWKRGETGFPIVDAGMRQLRAEAWMHNRVRMIVASFLTKDLLVDWRAGYAWFRERLVDHDTANDVGGWQWAASTGTDAQPYFRVFNPTTQAERHDPDGSYVRRYVPELEGVPADVIHAWDDLAAAERQRHAPAYPAPIVDHAERREQAIETFERARGE